MEKRYAPGGGKGDKTQKVTITRPLKTFLVGKKKVFFKKIDIFKAIFVDFYLDPGKKFSGLERGAIKCRRGNSDFTIQEGGNRTLPPHARKQKCYYFPTKKKFEQHAWFSPFFGTQIYET